MCRHGLAGNITFTFFGGTTVAGQAGTGPIARRIKVGQRSQHIAAFPPRVTAGLGLRTVAFGLDQVALGVDTVGVRHQAGLDLRFGDAATAVGQLRTDGDGSFGVGSRVNENILVCGLCCGDLGLLKLD